MPRSGSESRASVAAESKLAASHFPNGNENVATAFVLFAALLLLLTFLAAYLQTSTSAVLLGQPANSHAPTGKLAGAEQFAPLEKLFPLPLATDPLTTAYCAAVFTRHIHAKKASVWPPVCPLPATSPLRNAFEGPGRDMPISRDFCFAQRYEGEIILHWPEAEVDATCAAIASGADLGSYNSKEVAQVRDALAQWAMPAGDRGLVIGSERPWVECLALNAGARVVTTWEYSTILTDHPRLRAAPTAELAHGFASGAREPVDWVVSFSSLEHSGLGRYGDAPNPDGDRAAMEEALCALRPGGVLALGVPMSCASRGYIEFNAHRVYGYERLAFIAAGYELLAFQGVGCEEYSDATANPQPIVLLRRPMAGVTARVLTADDFARAASTASAANT